MFTTYFSYNQLLLLSLTAIFYLIGLYYFVFKNNNKLSLLFLFIGGLITRLVLISFDDYFHAWDEQYHALVAKNMLKNPFVPMLYEHTPLKYDISDWTSNHIWLHKQPLFLWQIALSIKLLGNSVFAVRLPSAIMSSLLILVIFRIGTLILNKQVGYIAAFLFTVCNYLIEFNTGIYATDHNDVAFIFYVTLSIWAYTEYTLVKKTKYLWLIGIFAGFAILNKWLTGMLVFSGWGIGLLFIHDKQSIYYELKNMLKSLGICLLTFFPWQIYILVKFPIESQNEFMLNSKHFFEVVEGHGGDYWFHFNQAIIQYGAVAAYILPLALIILFYDIKNTIIKISFITWTVTVYLFFSLAKTKMPAFCLVVSPIMFLALANILHRTIITFENILKKEKISKAVIFLLLVSMGVMSMNIENIQRNHTTWIKDGKRTAERKSQTRITEFAKSIKGKYEIEKTIVFNCNNTDNIPIMFFSGYTAYNRIPSFEEYQYLKKDGYKILYLNSYSTIPEYLVNDKDVLILNATEKKEKYIRLKAGNRKYLSVAETPNSFVISNKDTAALKETFSLIDYGNNEHILLSYNNYLLSVELDKQNEVTARRQHVGEWEIFKITMLNNNFVALKAANGKFLSLEEASGLLFAKGDTIGEFEKFEIFYR